MLSAFVKEPDKQSGKLGRCQNQNGIEKDAQPVVGKKLHNPPEAAGGQQECSQRRDAKKEIQKACDKADAFFPEKGTKQAEPLQQAPEHPDAGQKVKGERYMAIMGTSYSLTMVKEWPEAFTKRRISFVRIFRLDVLTQG